MKFLLLILITCFIGFTPGCTHESKSKQQNRQLTKWKDSVIHQEIPANQKEIREVCSFLVGLWLPSEYLVDLMETQSAFLASRSIPTIAEIQFDPGQVTEDSAYIGVSLGNHEGYGFNAWINPNKENALTTNACNWEKDRFKYELHYTVGVDTTLFLKKFDLNGKLIKSTKYIRVLGADYLSDYGGLGYQFIARKYLLSGSYQLLDSMQNEVGKLTFNPYTEEVSGYDYPYYDLLTDYEGSLPYEGNIVFFASEPKAYNNLKSYALEIKGDTLELWTTAVNKVNDTVYLKNLTAYLVKQPN